MAEETTQSNLGDDKFVRRVILRQVRKVIATSNLTNDDRDDLVQEAYTQVTKSLESFDPAVGHIRPFIVTVVQRHLGNVVRDRNVAKRATRGRVSLVRPSDPRKIPMWKCPRFYTTRTKIDD